MKKVFYLLTVAVFVLSVSLAVAGDQKPASAPAGMKKAQKTVNCCLGGKCKKAASVDICAKLGGKTVKDCMECK